MKEKKSKKKMCRSYLQKMKINTVYGQTLKICADRHALFIFPTTTNEIIKSFKSNMPFTGTVTVECLAMDPLERFVAVCFKVVGESTFVNITVWDLERDEMCSSMTGLLEDNFWAMAISSCGTRLLGTVESKNEMRLYNVESSELVKKFSGGQYAQISFSPHVNNFIVKQSLIVQVFTMDGEFRMIDRLCNMLNLETFRQVTSTTYGLVVLFEDGRIELNHHSSFANIWRRHKEYFYGAFSVSPCGQELVLCSRTCQKLTILSTQTGATIQKNIMRCEFNPDIYQLGGKVVYSPGGLYLIETDRDVPMIPLYNQAGQQLFALAHALKGRLSNIDDVLRVSEMTRRKLCVLTARSAIGRISGD